MLGTVVLHTLFWLSSSLGPTFVKGDTKWSGIIKTTTCFQLIIAVWFDKNLCLKVMKTAASTAILCFAVCVYDIMLFFTDVEWTNKHDCTASSNSKQKYFFCITVARTVMWFVNPSNGNICHFLKYFQVNLCLCFVSPLIQLQRSVVISGWTQINQIKSLSSQSWHTSPALNILGRPKWERHNSCGSTLDWNFVNITFLWKSALLWIQTQFQWTSLKLKML